MLIENKYIEIYKNKGVINMKTPKNYTENLKNNIITKSMLKDCLYSVNKRAKNCRDKERQYSYDYRYQDHYRISKEAYYAQKETMLSVLKPTCIHVEVQEHIEKFYDYEYEYDEMMARGNYIYENEYYDREMNRYVSFIKATVRQKHYYLFYELDDKSFHTPIDEYMLKNYPNLEIKDIGSIITHGSNIDDLISCQFVKKVIELIKSKTYVLDLAS